MMAISSLRLLVGVIAVCMLLSLCHSDITGAIALRTTFPSSTEGEAQWWNTSLPIAMRVQALVANLTLDEKLSQLLVAPNAIPRLDIPNYTWGQECLHGVRSNGDNFTTVFPQPIVLGASWNTTLVRLMAEAISDELRALNNHHAAGVGLDCWAPNINIFRDPRWGRGHETYGEDTFLASSFVIQYVQGLQHGPQYPEYIKIISTCKHFTAYSLEEYQGTERHEFDANVTGPDLVDTYLPNWEACVQDAGGLGVMASYNEVNGIPMVANPMLQTVLRDQMGFEGYVVSDCGAVDDVWEWHKYVETRPEAAAVSLNAGTDIDCGTAYTNLTEALAQGLTNTSNVDLAVTRLMTLRMQLGLFDPPSMVNYTNIPTSVIDSEEHRELALEAAQQGMVLLKNENGMLPLTPSTARKIAIVGPMANNTAVLLGNYHGTPSFTITPYQGLQNYADRFNEMRNEDDGDNMTVSFSLGAQIIGEGTWMFEAAATLADANDVVIVCVGNSAQGTPSGLNPPFTGVATEKEGLDRTLLSIPQAQDDLVRFLYKRTRTPIVVVLVNGWPLSLGWIKDDMPTILEAWFPGEQAGAGLANVLFGEYNPAGRLPVTMYSADYTEQINFGDMNMRSWPGRTYKYLQVEPEYPFGFGLSYTNFSCVWSAPPAIPQGNDVTSTPYFYTVNVTNIGNSSGSTVVQLFLEKPMAWKASPPLSGSAPTSGVGVTAVRELVAFNATPVLSPGESITMSLSYDGLKLMQTTTKRMLRHINASEKAQGMVPTTVLKMEEIVGGANLFRSQASKHAVASLNTKIRVGGDQHDDHDHDYDDGGDVHTFERDDGDDDVVRVLISGEYRVQVQYVGDSYIESVFRM
eukprot:TRINITY_DN9217_c0_g1_i1.p1 TRINITY_DN9217_c0_g1~~TRINITY_DN9217_c0_g1_i1.p1  ORF type:complete len:859 (+),score=185.94 TRINITY_DN9217_c0_g1_i1:121-2697(+)